MNGIVHGSSAAVFYTTPFLVRDVDIIVNRAVDDVLVSEKTVHGFVQTRVNGSIHVDYLVSEKLYNGIVANKWYNLFDGIMVVVPEWIIAEKMLKIIDLSDHYSPSLFYDRIRIVKQYLDLAVLGRLNIDRDRLCNIVCEFFSSVADSCRTVLTNIELWYGGVFAYYFADIDYDRIKDVYIRLYDMVRRCRR